MSSKSKDIKERFWKKGLTKPPRLKSNHLSRNRKRRYFQGLTGSSL
jgi:hypothetical protein